MLFEKENLKVRLLQEKDKPLLVKWLSDSAVLEFYEGRDNPFDLDRVNQKFYNEEKMLFAVLQNFMRKRSAISNFMR